MSHYKPYPVYKDSGVEWIGEVPEHWKIRPVKHLYQVRLGKMIQPQPKSEEDVLVPYHRAQTVQWERIEHSQVEKMWIHPSEIDSYSLENGDLLICEGGDVCRASVFNLDKHETVIFQNSLHRVRPINDNEPEWLLRLMQHVRSSGWIDVLCNKNTIVHFTSDKLRSLETPHPPPSEQAEILSTLRRETARIDALIAKKTEFIELLAKKRQALITHAVTKGLDPNVKMKDSGVEWIGEVPEHWGVRRIKFAISSCRNGVWGDDPTGNGDVPCVRVADFNRDTLRVNSEIPTLRKISENDRDSRRLRRGNLLLEKSGGGERQPVGQVVLYDRDDDAVCSNFIAKIELSSCEDSAFWCYQFAAAYACGLNLRSVKQTSGIQNLDQEQYFDEIASHPPHAEQVAIAAFLDRETARIDLLKKRRSALITAAVTGQIDLRESA
jgi:type I restriction enzyme S subunit